MAFEESDIIRKIKALILLQNSSNPSEAASAAAKAQELLAKWNLDIDDVMKHGNKEFITVRTDVLDVYAYLRGLGMAVADAHFCAYYYVIVPTKSKKRKKDGTASFYNREAHAFCGLTHNANVAVMMFDYLQKTIFRLARAAAKAKAAEEDSKFSWSYVTAFQNGACFTVAKRLRDSIPTEEAAAAAPEGSNLPALRSLHERSIDEVNEFLSKQVKLVKSKPRAQNYDDDGVIDGMVAGKEIGLNTQITEQKRKQLA